MSKAVIFTWLVLAGAAVAACSSVSELRPVNPFPPSGQFIEHNTSSLEWLCADVERTASEGPYVYEVCGNTLRRVGSDQGRRAGNLASRAGSQPSGAPAMPVWKQASAYALEFAAAGVGAVLAEACGLTAVECAYQAGWNGPGGVAGGTAFLVTSTVLTAGGTHLVGRLFGRGNTFNRALVGGAVGGLLGGAAFVDYFVTRKEPHSFMLPVGLILPPLCSVVIYNVWRNDGTK